MTQSPSTPLSQAKDYGAPSVFLPENLLREARRQKNLPLHNVPEICVLDPDGDIVRHVRSTGLATPASGWACYHTDLDTFSWQGSAFGIVGGAVGAPFAVLVAEQLFASGCRFLISITSSGWISQEAAPAHYILIERALRDEGTSHHYQPAELFAQADPALAALVMSAMTDAGLAVRPGTTWTTDAPYRETQAAIAAARAQNILAVEMEAAALYAFARARGRPVICLAHVTNQMAQVDGDFEKGAANGAHDALAIMVAAARAWQRGP